MKVKSLSRVRLFTTPWSAANQAPPSMGFSRQEYWSGVPLPSPAVLIGKSKDYIYIYISMIFLLKKCFHFFVCILSLIIFDISITYFFHISRGFNSTYIAKGFFFFLNIFQMKKLRLQELVSKALSLSKDSAALHYYICSMPSSLSVDDMKN